MNTLLKGGVASIVRFLLAAYGGFLAARGIEGISSDPASVTVLEIVYGTISVGLAWALKFVDGSGPKGALVANLVGPKIRHIAWSASRWLVGIAAGLTTALVDPSTGELLVPDLGDTPVVAVVSLTVAFLYDRATKVFRP